MIGRNGKHDPISEEALEWLLRVEAAPDNQADRSALEAWRRQSPAHEEAWQRVAQVWRLAGDLPSEYTEQMRATSKSAPGAERDIDPGQLGLPRGKKRRLTASNSRVLRHRRSAIGMAAAVIVACLLIAIAPVLHLRIEADHLTGTGEIRQITLEDGSRLHLAAKSAVALDYEASRRTVRLLAGQAYFDVTPAPTRPFLVPLGGLSVKVTGTRFAIDRSAASTSVAVQSGTVEVAVHKPNGEDIRLSPGNQLTLTHETGAVTLRRVLPAEIASWRDGRFVADGVPLAKLVEELNRYHRGVIWVRGAALAERRITGVFDLDEPIAALRAAASAQDAEVTELTPYILVVTAR